MANAKPIPEGFQTLTPHIVVRNASEVIDFYKKAFSAEEVLRIPGPDGKSVMHAELKIGDSMLMLGDEFPDMKGCQAPQSINGTTFTLHLYVQDVDAAFDRAVKAGCQVVMPIMDMFWGDRYGKLTDPFGHHWSIATHTEDVSSEECAKRAEAFFSQKGPGPGCDQSK